MLPTLSVTHAWIILFCAILFEVGGTTSMRLSEGFTRLTPSIMIFVFYAISFALNTLVIRTLGLSVTYAVWSGVGTVLTSIIGYAVLATELGRVFDLPIATSWPSERILPEAISLRFMRERHVLPAATEVWLGDATQAPVAPASQDFVLQSAQQRLATGLLTRDASVATSRRLEDTLDALLRQADYGFQYLAVRNADGAVLAARGRYESLNRNSLMSPAVRQWLRTRLYTWMGDTGLLTLRDELQSMGLGADVRAEHQITRTVAGGRAPAWDEVSVVQSASACRSCSRSGEVSSSGRSVPMTSWMSGSFKPCASRI